MKTAQVVNAYLTIEASEALTKKRFVDNQGKHTADIKAVGVTWHDTDSGSKASLIGPGNVAVVTAAGAITLGTHTFVKSDADGKAVGTSTFDGKVCGVPLDTVTADGDEIRILVG